MDDFRSLAVPLQQIGTNLGMSAFHFVIRRLSDIVEQSTTSPQRTVQAEHLGKTARQESNLNGMSQHILAIACAKVESAEHVDHTLMQTVNFNLLGRFLTLLLDVLLDFALGLCNDFFNA